MLRLGGIALVSCTLLPVAVPAPRRDAPAPFAVPTSATVPVPVVTHRYRPHHAFMLELDGDPP